jgi:hypothetical protein
MAPIYNPNGNEVSEIVLPNGNTASEVIAPDGSMVASFGPPDSVVSRPDDDNSNSGAYDLGLRFETSQDWPDFQTKLSSNTTTASDEELVIGDTSGGDIATKDISGKSAGDVITFSGINLSANTAYSVYGRTSNSRTYGYRGTPGFPFTSSDGNLTITGGWLDGSENTTAYHIVTVGDITL